MNCGACDYWKPSELDTSNGVDPDSSGQCRRHAPVANMHDSDFESGRYYLDAVWPVTSATDGCGDYQRHPTRRLTDADAG